MIARALASGRAAHEPVAFGREGARDARALRRDVAALAAALAPARRQRILLHAEDAYAFAVGLLAAGRVGACAVLPPSGQPGALRRAAAGTRLALLGDDAAAETLAGVPCLHPLRPAEGPATAAPEAAAEPWLLGRDDPWVELSTSGTTGASRRVVKARRHLEDEVAMLEGAFGARLGEARVLATVAPQHLYGLLFRVLWPLAAGRPFLRTPLLHPAEFAPHLAANAPAALVATPVALRPWVERSEREAPAFARDLCALFTSGGPLDAPLARRAAARFGSAPFEIYGSTETGGVAVRQQHRGEEPWSPLPGVRVEEDPQSGCLAVVSPFVSQGEPREGGLRFVLGDRATLHGDGRFALRGRADRVVKIGEKRLWLPEMERRLADHPALAEVALAPFAPEPDAEPRVGALLVPSEEGRALLAASGRRALAKLLTEHLAPDFDRVLLPRVWRVVRALPRNAQGKLPLEALRAALETEDPEPEAPWPGAGEAAQAQNLPALHVVEASARHLVARLRIAADLPFLEGHFPGEPLVAGVVQVHLAMHGLARLLGEAPRLAALEALKFHEVLRPGDVAQLRVELEPGAERFRFTLHDAARPERTFASARGRLAPRAAAGPASSSEAP